MDDDLLPARMVNEFVYCPRLFYLEWVEARFAESDDTRLGRQVHRRVDTEAGAAPLPEEGELRAARSLMLSSQELGVIAKLDLVEGEGGLVVPVDYKKGAPQPDGSPWPSDEVQVCLQALVLREHGYRCEHAELYYVATRQRVRVELTAERIGRTRGLVADAREVAARVAPPLPLVGSPKCVRCSLVGLCLPDETNALLARRDQPPRRLVPRDPDQRPVYVTEPGSFVGLRSGRLEITRNKEKLASFRMLDVAQLAVFGRVQVSTQALHECFAREIPVLWLSTGGWLQGFAVGQPSKYVELRRRQTAVHAQAGAGLAQQMIAGKILNSRVLLRRNARGDVSGTVAALKRLAEQARGADNFATLLGIEGTAARMYFAALPSMLAEPGRGVRRRVLPAGPQPPPAAGPAQCAAVVLLLDADQGPGRDHARGGSGSLPGGVPPLAVRPSRPGAGSGRGVPAADRGLGGDRPAQQRGGDGGGLPPPRGCGVVDRGRATGRAAGLRAAVGHRDPPSGVRLPDQLPAGDGRAGPAARGCAGG